MGVLPHVFSTFSRINYAQYASYPRIVTLSVIGHRQMTSTSRHVLQIAPIAIAPLELSLKTARQVFVQSKKKTKAAAARLPKQAIATSHGQKHSSNATPNNQGDTLQNNATFYASDSDINLATMTIIFKQILSLIRYPSVTSFAMQGANKLNVCVKLHRENFNCYLCLGLSELSIAM